MNRDFCIVQPGSRHRRGLGGGLRISMEQESLLRGRAWRRRARERVGFPSGPQTGSGLVRLTLRYQHALGTTRVEGFILLRELRLTVAVAGCSPIIPSNEVRSGRGADSQIGRAS